MARVNQGNNNGQKDNQKNKPSDKKPTPFVRKAKTKEQVRLLRAAYHSPPVGGGEQYYAPIAAGIPGLSPLQVMKWFIDHRRRGHAEGNRACYARTSLTGDVVHSGAKRRSIVHPEEETLPQVMSQNQAGDQDPMDAEDLDPRVAGHRPQGDRRTPRHQSRGSIRPAANQQAYAPLSPNTRVNLNLRNPRRRTVSSAQSQAGPSTRPEGSIRPAANQQAHAPPRSNARVIIRACHTPPPTQQSEPRPRPSATMPSVVVERSVPEDIRTPGSRVIRVTPVVNDLPRIPGSNAVVELADREAALEKRLNDLKAEDDQDTDQVAAITGALEVVLKKSKERKEEIKETSDELNETRKRLNSLFDGN